MTDNMLMLCEKLEQVAKERSLAALSDYGQFRRAFLMAEGIGQLRQMISPEALKPIMSLQNSSLGFRTDKTDGYPENVVKEAFIEAVLRGLQAVGNQFNIISGRCYITKEGFTHLLKNIPGLTDLRLVPSAPAMGNGMATVHYKATWKYHGVEDGIERDITVRINSGMGSDGALGKAERKIRAAVYAQITGTTVSDGDVSDLDTGSVNAQYTKAPSTATESINEALKNGGVAARNKRIREIFTISARIGESIDALKANIGEFLGLGRPISDNKEIPDERLDDVIELYKRLETQHAKS